MTQMNESTVLKVTRAGRLGSVKHQVTQRRICMKKRKNDEDTPSHHPHQKLRARRATAAATNVPFAHSRQDHRHSKDRSFSGGGRSGSILVFPKVHEGLFGASKLRALTPPWHEHSVVVFPAYFDHSKAGKCVDYTIELGNCAIVWLCFVFRWRLSVFAVRGGDFAGWGTLFFCQAWHMYAVSILTYQTTPWRECIQVVNPMAPKYI